MINFFKNDFSSIQHFSKNKSKNINIFLHFFDQFALIIIQSSPTPMIHIGTVIFILVLRVSMAVITVLSRCLRFFSFFHLFNVSFHSSHFFLFLMSLHFIIAPHITIIPMNTYSSSTFHSPSSSYLAFFILSNQFNRSLACSFYCCSRN